MKASIVIPFYNRLDLLKNTLSRLSVQTVDPNVFEVIVIDDGSDNDNKKYILSLFPNLKISYKYFPRSEKSGSSFARNKGIELSKGEYLIFLDCDQMVQPDFVESHLKFFSVSINPHFVLQLGARRNLDQGQDYTQPSLDTLKGTIDIRELLFETYSENMALITTAWHLAVSHNFSVSRRAIDRFGAFDEGFKGWGLEDCEFGYRMTKAGLNICFNPNIQAYHQYHEFIFDEKRVRAWKENFKFFKEKYNATEVDLQLFIESFVDNQKEGKVKASIKDQRFESWVYDWADSFIAMETAARQLNECHQPIIFNRVLKEPDVTDVHSLLMSNSNIGLTVLSSRSNIELLAWVQQCKERQRIQLFTY